MTKGPREEKMHLDMPFDEALERFIGTDTAEVAANLEKSKAAKPPADRVLQSANKPDQTNLTKLSPKRGTGSRSRP
jgi:hypothetical protein